MPRDQAVGVVRKTVPTIYPLIFLFMSAVAGSVFGYGGLAYCVAQESGAVAGDVLGSFLFCCAAAPAFAWIKSILAVADALSLWVAYVDDTASHAEMAAQLKVYAYLLEPANQDKHGLYPNVKKGFCLMGPRGSRALAVAEQKEYHEKTGMPLANIKIHPSDSPEGKRDEYELAYGIVYLGTPIGSDAYIRAWLRQYLATLKDDLYAMATYPDPQGLLLLVRQCFLPKVVHLARTLPAGPDQPYEAFAKAFEELMRTFVMEAVLRIPSAAISDLSWDQTKLKHTLAFSMPADIAAEAYLAATISVSPNLPPALLDKLKVQAVGVNLPEEASPLQLAFQWALERHARATIPVTPGVPAGTIPNLEATKTRAATLSYQMLADEVTEANGKGQHVLTLRVQEARRLSMTYRKGMSNEDNIRLQSSADPVGSLWARIIPWAHWKQGRASIYYLSPAAFRTAVCRLLGIPLGPGTSTHSFASNDAGTLTLVEERVFNGTGALWAKPLKCGCTRGPQIDPDLQHSWDCGFNRIVTKVHDAVRSLLGRFAKKYVGCTGVREEVKTGQEVDAAGNVRAFRDSDLLMDVTFAGLPGHKPTATKTGLDVKTKGSNSGAQEIRAYKKHEYLHTCDHSRYHKDQPPHHQQMHKMAEKYFEMRKERQHESTDLYFFYVDSFGGVPKLTNKILAAMAQKGSERPGYWYDKPTKLLHRMHMELSHTIANVIACETDYLITAAANKAKVVDYRAKPVSQEDVIEHLRDITIE
jgi:hypothetical protein